MVASGLQSEAVLKLRVQLDSDDIQDTKKLLTDLTNAFKAQSAMKGMTAMETALKQMQQEVTRLKGELSKYQRAEKAAEAAKKASAAASKNQANAEKGLITVTNLAGRAFQQAGTAQKLLTAGALQNAKAQKLLTAGTIQSASANARLQQGTIQAAGAQRLLATGAIRLGYTQQQVNNIITKTVGVVQRVVGAIKGWNIQQKILNANANRGGGAMASLSQKFNGVRGALRNLTKNIGEAEEDFDALFRAAFRLQMVGWSLRSLSQTLTRFGSDIMDTFGEFEYMMIRAAGTLSIWKYAVPGVTATYGDLQNRILSLAADMKMFPAKDIAEAMYFWGSTTGQVVKTQEDLKTTTEALNVIMRAAVMTNTDYETTIKGVYSILTQFYGGALDYAVTVTEQLFYTTQKTAAEFGDLISSFKMVGPVAAQMGVTFSEVNEILGNLADLGIRGSQAGRGLRQLFIQTLRPSGPALEKLSEVWARQENVDQFGGKSFQETIFPESQYVGATEQIRILARATMEMEDADRQAVLAKIATANELPILTALVTQQRLEIQGLQTANEKLADSETVAHDNFERNWAGMASSWNALRGQVDRAIESLKINLGSIMAQALKPFMDSMTEVIRKIEQFIKLNPQIVTFMSKVGAAIAVISGAAGYFFIAAGAIIGLVAAIGVANRVIGKFWGLVGKTAAVFALLATAVIDNAQYIIDAIKEISDNIATAFSEAGNSAFDLADAIDSVTEPARAFMGLIVRSVADLAKFASGIFKIVAGLNDLLGGGALPLIVQLISAFVSAKILVGILSMVAGILKINVAFKALQGVMIGTAATGVGLFARLSAGVAGLLTNPMGLLVLGATLVSLAYEMIPGFKDAVDGAETGSQKWSASVKSLNEELGTLADTLSTGVLSDVMESFNVKGLWDNYNKMVASMPKGMRTPLPEVIDAARIARENEENAKKAAAATLENIKNGFKDINLRALQDNDPIISGDDFIRMILGTESATGVDALTASKIVRVIAAQLGSDTTLSELKKYYTNNQGLLAGMDFDAFLGIADFITSVGKASEEAGKKAIGVIDDALAMTLDPAEMARFLTKPLTELGGYSIARISAGEGDFTDEVVKFAQFVMQKQQEAVLGAIDSVGQTGQEFEDQMKMAQTSMIEQVFIKSFPSYTEFAGMVEGYAMGGQFEELASYLLTSTIDGITNTMEYLVNSDTFGSDEILAIAEKLVEQGYGGPEFAAMVSRLSNTAEAAGEDIGSETRKSLIEGIISGAQDYKITGKELKDLRKIGSGQDIVKGIFGSVGRHRAALFGNKSTFATRQRGREAVRGGIDVYESRRQTLGPRGRKQLDKQFLESTIPQVSSYPPGLRNKIIEAAQKINAKHPEIVRQALKGKPKLLDLILKESLKPSGEVLGPPAPGAGGASAITGPIVDLFNSIPTNPEITTGATTAGTSIVSQVGAAVTTAAENYDFSATILALSNSIDSANSSTSDMKDSGSAIANKVVSGIKTINSEGNVGAIKDAMWGAVKSASETVASYAPTYGGNVATAFINGFNSKLNSYTIDITGNFVASIKGDSPPKRGPLKDIDKWGYNVGAAWGDSFTKGSVERASRMAQDVRAMKFGHDGILNSRAEFTNTHKREVRVRLEVSSPDGTVNRQKQGEMRRGAMDALVVADLEHYVTVG
jgi:TP901 family phage tail tape measure protein